MGPHFLSVLNNRSTSYLMDNWQFVLGTMQITLFFAVTLRQLERKTIKDFLPLMAVKQTSYMVGQTN